MQLLMLELFISHVIIDLSMGLLKNKQDIEPRDEFIINIIS